MKIGFLNPEQVLNKLELTGDMIAADFGSGSGGWAIPLAKKLKFGKIYAIDILNEPLSALKSKAEIQRVYNIETINSDVEKGVKLPDFSCDLVLLTNLLFQVEDKKKVLTEAKRVLKKGGEILIIDWLPESPQGPKEGKVPPKEVKKFAEDLKLKLKKEFQAGAFHYGLIFTKP